MNIKRPNFVPLVAERVKNIINIFTVSLFGHREIYDIRQLNDKLTPIIKNLIQTQSYVSFLIGRNGEFDTFAASVIKHAQKESKKESSDITLVLPYPIADIEYYEKYYDSIIIPECLHGSHPKSAITLKNRWMIEQSNLVIVYVERNIGGAYNAMKYAEKLNKKIVNLYNNEKNDIVFI